MNLIPITLLSLILWIACSTQSKQKQGEEMIAKVEQFKIREKRLPRLLEEMEMRESEEGPIYYRQLHATRFGMGPASANGFITIPIGILGNSEVTNWICALKDLLRAAVEF